MRIALQITHASGSLASLLLAGSAIAAPYWGAYQGETAAPITPYTQQGAGTELPYAPVAQTAMPAAPAVPQYAAYVPVPAPAQAPMNYDNAMPFDDMPAPTAGTRYRDRFALGLELFHDNYQEPQTFPDLDNNAYYGSIEGQYEHDFTKSLFGGLEGRVSYGQNGYKSSQGKIDGVPQWEFEARMLGGYQFTTGRDQRLKLYTGLGTRYYLDQAKGEFTTGGAAGYDRRIFQLYAPIGATYEFPAWGWNFAPNLEFDPLLYGHVESRLGNVPGYQNFGNRQEAGSGHGIRGEFMMGKNRPDGTGWQFGPFFRYWDVDDSELDRNASGTALEPANERFQGGVKLRGKF